VAASKEKVTVTVWANAAAHNIDITSPNGASHNIINLRIFNHVDGERLTRCWECLPPC
jgi:hypothetical protein